MNRLAALLVSATLVGSSQGSASADESPWIRVKIDLADKVQRAALLQSDIDVAEIEGLEADVLVTSVELDDLRAQGYATRVVKEFSHGPRPRDSATTPEFLAEYYTYTEAMTKLTNLAAAYPSLTSLSTLGFGVQPAQRAINALKISDNAAVDEDEPEVLVMGCHHSREAISVIVPLALADSLLLNYGTNPQYTEWVDEREIWIVPVVNPDGLSYCETNDYFWRKNRRNNGNGSFGVDPNRNYAYEWGHDNVGSSPSGFDQTYRGTSAASEPEIQAIQNFVDTRQFVFALSYHSFGNWLLWGPGYKPAHSPDQDIFVGYGEIATAVNGFEPGNPASGTIYLTNGDADDWLYHSPTHSKILAMTPEVGNGDDYFNPPASRIPQLVRDGLENVWPALQYAPRPSQLAPPGLVALASLPVDNDGAYDVTWSAPTIADTQPVQYEILEKTGPAVATDGAEAGTGNFVMNGWTTSTVRKFAGARSFFSAGADRLDRTLWAKEPYVVQPGDAVTFRAWWDLETAYDYFYVVLSTDGGRSFVTLDDDSTYTTMLDPNGRNADNGITGESGGVAFRALSFSLTSWVGQSVLLGFRNNTDEGTADEGVYLDEIRPVQTFATSTTLSSSVAATSYSISGKVNGTYYYAVRGQDAEADWGYWSAHLPVTVDLATSALASVSRSRFELAPGRPTPFGDRTEIRFQLPTADTHTLRVYDVSGRRVRTLSEGMLPAGSHAAVWDGRDERGRAVPAGVYFFELRAPQGELRQRTVLLR